MYFTNIKDKTMDCKMCKEEIHPKRLEILPNTKTCVECSTDAPKKGVAVMQGTGDNTWVDLMVMEEDEFTEYENKKKVERKGGGLDKTTE